jgi:hypothetical protein
MTGLGTLVPVDVALHEAGHESKGSFAVCATASLTKLIADIAGQARNSGQHRVDTPVDDGLMARRYSMGSRKRALIRSMPLEMACLRRALAPRVTPIHIVGEPVIAMINSIRALATLPIRVDADQSDSKLRERPHPGRLSPIFRQAGIDVRSESANFLASN